MTDTASTGTVHTESDGHGAYFLQARLDVRLPGVEREVAQALVDEAHQTCAYSKATRANIDVVINLV